MSQNIHCKPILRIDNREVDYFTQVNFADGSAVVGDWIKLVCDGSAWYIVGGLGKVAAGITIS